MQPQPGRRAPAEFDIAALRGDARTHVPAGPPPESPVPALPGTRARRLPALPSRAPAAAVAGALVGVLTSGLWLGLCGSGGGAPGPDLAGPPPADWAAVVRGLDRVRAQAFAAADPAALREVYAPGSAALATDTARLTELRSRGLRGEGLSVQIVDVALRAAGTGSVELAVVDRLDRYTLTDRHHRVRASMPGRGEAGWQVRLVPSGTGGWRIEAVSPA